LSEEVGGGLRGVFSSFGFPSEKTSVTVLLLCQKHATGVLIPWHPTRGEERGVLHNSSIDKWQL